MLRAVAGPSQARAGVSGAGERARSPGSHDPGLRPPGGRRRHPFEAARPWGAQAASISRAAGYESAEAHRFYSEADRLADTAAATESHPEATADGQERRVIAVVRSPLLSLSAIL